MQVRGLIHGLVAGWVLTASAEDVRQNWDTGVYGAGALDVTYAAGTVGMRHQFTGDVPTSNSPVLTGLYSGSGGVGTGDSLRVVINGGDTSIHTITFTEPVDDLAFSVYDIDGDDEVTITAVNGAIPVDPALTREDPANATFVIDAVTNTASGTGNNSGSSSDNGTMTATFAAAVTQVVIEYSQGGGADSYALSDLNFSTTDPPAIACNASLVRLDWAAVSYSTGDLNESFAVNDPGGGSVTVDFSYAGNVADFGTPEGGGIAAPHESSTYTGAAGGIGNNGAPSLSFLHDPRPNADSPEVTVQVDFDQNVQDLRFSMHDIDSLVNGQDFLDEVRIVGYRNFGLASEVVVMPVPQAVASGTAGGRSLVSQTYGIELNAVTGEAILASHDFDDETVNDPRSSVNVFFPDLVDRVEIVYTDLGGFNGSREVTLSDLQFCPPSSVPVTISFFDARPDGLVTWQAASETMHLGYRLFAGDPRTGGRPLTDLLAPTAGTVTAAVDYEHQIDDQLAGDLYLQAVDVFGSHEIHGPFAVGGRHGERITTEPVDWRQAQHELRQLAARRPKSDVAHALDLGVASTGVHRVTYEMLRDAGLDLAGVDADAIAITLRGEPVARQVVTTGATTFGPGAAIDFHGEAPTGADARYLSQTRYRVSTAPALARPASSNHAVPSVFAESYLQQVEAGEERFYGFTNPAVDPWFDVTLDSRNLSSRPRAKTYVLETSQVAIGNGELAVRLAGGLDAPAELGPDHHVLIELNGAVVADRHFDGIEAVEWSVPIDASLIREGSNEVTVSLAGDTGFGVDVVLVDSVTLTVPRRLWATDGRLQLSSPDAGFEVRGIGGPAVAYGLNGEQLVQLRVRQTADGVTFAGVGLDGEGLFADGFEGPGASRKADSGEDVYYWVSQVDRLLTPDVHPVAPVAPQPVEADYLIIAHPMFAGQALNRYVEDRIAAGWTPLVATVDGIYERHGHGMALPEAIRSYIAEAVAQGVTHVLLVGGDSYDYHDYRGTGSISFIPTMYAGTFDIIAHTPSDGLLGDVDGDEVADVAIGRWPVRTQADLQHMINKVAAFERRLAAERSLLLIADDRDPGADFTSQTEVLSAMLGWADAERVYLDQINAEGPPGGTRQHARDRIVASLNQGRTLTVYSGHGAPQLWAFGATGSILNASVAGQLGNGAAPSLFLPLTCYTSYWVEPDTQTLAQSLVNNGPRGAVALTGAATLSLYSSNFDMAAGIVTRLQQGLTLGEAVLRSRQDLAIELESQRDVIINWALLGDPTLRID